MDLGGLRWTINRTHASHAYLRSSEHPAMSESPAPESCISKQAASVYKKELEGNVQISMGKLTTTTLDAPSRNRKCDALAQYATMKLQDNKSARTSLMHFVSQQRMRTADIVAAAEMQREVQDHITAESSTTRTLVFQELEPVRTALIRIERTLSAPATAATIGVLNSAASVPSNSGPLAAASSDTQALGYLLAGCRGLLTARG